MAPCRQPIVVANWRCDVARIGEIAPFVDNWTSRSVDTKKVDVVICSAAVHIAFWRVRLQGTGLQVSVRNCSSSSAFVWDNGVAWTAKCLASLGVSWIVLGFKERRRRQLESSQQTSAKVACAQSAGIGVILCVGELSKNGPDSKENEEELNEMECIEEQLAAYLPRINSWDHVVVAYQPSLESRSTSAQHAEGVHAFIRDYVSKKAGEEVAQRLRIQYAGAVFTGNCRQYLEQENIDGFLVHDESLKHSFADIAQAAEDQLQPGPEFAYLPILNRSCFVRHTVNDNFPMFNVDFYDEKDELILTNLQSYYQLCLDSRHMMVTTSSFGNWRKAKKRNCGGKVIPALSSNTPGERVRVLFFDDNISMLQGGTASTQGICNLRNLETGEFIDFSEGKNGFKYDKIFRHTTVATTNEYMVVLIQVNILDAMANENYYLSIVEDYTVPGEKLIIYMDVNGTIVWDDTMAGKGISEVLLSTLFRLSEVRPYNLPSKLVFKDNPEIELSRNSPLKDIVRDIFHHNSYGYKEFWSPETCVDFLKQLQALGPVGWLGDTASFSPKYFADLFAQYLEELKVQVSADGIPNSWFKLYNKMKNCGNSTVINSFGMDTRRVVLRSVDEERQVVQVTINYHQWGQRDKVAYVDTYAP